MAKILLIEDDKTTAIMLSKFLTDGGHTVALAADGKAGVAAAAANPPDLVITDIFMPEKDGLETMSDIRKQKPGLPVIAISGGGAGASGSEILRIAHFLGATEVLRKPLASAEVLECVARCLKK